MENGDILVRPIEEKDLQFIEEIVIAAKAIQFKEENLTAEEIDTIRPRYSAEELRKRIADNYYYLAEIPSENKVVGVVGLRKDDGSEIHNRLSMFFIRPEYQGKGIGRLLYEKVKQTAIEKGCKKMVLSSSAVAEPIYAHFGFKKIRVDWKNNPRGPRSYNVWMEQEL